MAFNPTLSQIKDLWDIVSPYLGRDFTIDFAGGESVLFYNGYAISMNRWDVYSKLEDFILDIIEPDDRRSCIKNWSPFTSVCFLRPRCTEEEYIDMLKKRKLEKLIRSDRKPR